MNSEELKRRIKIFGLNVIDLINDMVPGKAANTIGYQLLPSATSVEANYRSAYRRRSKPEFIAKIGIAILSAFSITARSSLSKGKYGK
jgi:four helix bundle protein